MHYNLICLPIIFLILNCSPKRADEAKLTDSDQGTDAADRVMLNSLESIRYEEFDNENPTGAFKNKPTKFQQLVERLSDRNLINDIKKALEAEIKLEKLMREEQQLSPTKDPLEWVRNKKNQASIKIKNQAETPDAITEDSGLMKKRPSIYNVLRTAGPIENILSTYDMNQKNLEKAQKELSEIDKELADKYDKQRRVVENLENLQKDLEDKLIKEIKEEIFKNKKEDKEFEAQIKSLLATVEGRGFIESVAVYYSYKQLADQMQREIVEARIAKRKGQNLRDLGMDNFKLERYQRAYLTLIVTVRYAYDNYLLINEDQREAAIVYSGEVEEVIQENLDKERFSREEESEATADRSYGNNIERLREIKKFIAEYVKYLDEKATIIADKDMVLFHNLVEASANLATIEVSNDLPFEQIRMAISLFDTTKDLVLPQFGDIAGLVHTFTEEKIKQYSSQMASGEVN